MASERSDLEARIRHVADRLNEVEQRLVALERRAPEREIAYPDGYADEVRSAPAEAELAGRSSAAEVVPLVGRTLVVLAGAFALRAVTEMGIVPLAAGTTLGFAYAVLWMVLADRGAGAQRPRRARFDGLAAVAIAYPLLWEATVKFEFLPPWIGIAALSGITGLGLFIAARRKLRGLAWVVTLAAAATTLALAVGTRSLEPCLWFLLLLGLATWQLGYIREWRLLGGTVAVIVDAAVLLATAVVVLGDEARAFDVIHPTGLMAVQLCLVVVYFGSFFHRSFSTRVEVTPGEILQGVAVLLVGIGGAIAVTQATGVSTLSRGVISLLLAIGCYSASFAFIDRRLERRNSFIFYTSVALSLTLVALGSLLHGAALALALAAAALITAGLGSRYERATLSLHGAVYAMAAAVSSGLLVSAIDAFTGPTVPGPDWLNLSNLTVLLVAGICSWLPVAIHGKTWGRFSRAPKLVVVSVLLAGIGAIAVTLIAILLPHTDGAGSDRAALAVARTGVLALSALALAVVSRITRAPEATWLVYAVLVLGGSKLLLEDLRTGRPATLFLSLALYGGALIFAPRLVRRSKPAAPD